MTDEALHHAETHDALEGIAPPSAATRLVGHSKAIEQLERSASAGHHAVILEGVSGIGKATAAFILAKLQMGAKGSFADGVDAKDPVHRQIAQGAHPNLIHVTRPWSSQTKKWKTGIGVDQIRALHDFLGMTASGNEPRIIIVDPLQDMNRNAANALLKMLEEPPQNTLFLLISQGAGSVLPTIRSRAQMVRFAPLEPVEVSRVLADIAPSQFDDQEAGALANLSGGSVRHSLVMGLYGGQELLSAVDRSMNADQFDTKTVHKLAEIAADRKQPTQAALVFDMLQEALHSHAVHAAHNGDVRRASDIAEKAQQLSQQRRTDEAFNIDRKHAFLVAARHVYKAIHGQK